MPYNTCIESGNRKKQVTKAKTYTYKQVAKMQDKVIIMLSRNGVEWGDMPDVYAMDIDELVELYDDLMMLEA